MNALLAMCALMLVGSAYCGEDPRARPIGPRPIAINRQCRASTGGWRWTALAQTQYPPPTSNTFYYGCKVWRPSYSRCTGGCPSSTSVTVLNNKPSVSPRCTCCKHTGLRLGRPRPYCLVIRIRNNRPTWRWEFVRHTINGYNYAVVSGCRCNTCVRRPFPFPGLPGPAGRPGVRADDDDDDVDIDDLDAVDDETKITGYVKPPTASAAETDRALAGAGLPGLTSGGGRPGGRPGPADLPVPEDFRPQGGHADFEDFEP